MKKKPTYKTIVNKNDMKQRVLSLVVAIFATTALWAYDFKMGGLYYTITHTSEPYTVEIVGGDSMVTELSIPNAIAFNDIVFSVTSIGDGAFSGRTNITSINIPNSLKNIGERAFRGCSNLESIVVENGNLAYDSRDNCNAIIETEPNILVLGCKNTIIPNDVMKIGDYSFYSSNNLFSITIPNSVTSIGLCAFARCKDITSITIPRSVTNIDVPFGTSMFVGCPNLISIIVERGNTKYDSRDNCNAIIETSINTLIAGCQTSSVPDSVVNIGDYAFYCCTGLTSITMGNSVTSIGNYAFSDCTGITSIVIGDSVTSIGNCAFYNCTSLTSISIPDGVTSIQRGTFSGCTSLTSITIPNCVTDIAESAFANCTSLASVVLPNDLISIGRICYSSRYPSCLSAGVFYNCISLTSIAIPNNVKTIGDNTFSGCKGLTSVTIGKQVAQIGGYAFQDCLQIKRLVVRAFRKPSTPTFKCALCGSSIDSVYVPCGTKETYSNWSYLSADKIVAMCDVPQYAVSIISENILKGDVHDNYTGNSNEWNISATANPYYQFSHWSDGNTDNPRVLTVTQDTTLIAYFVPATSGKCGDDLYWSYWNDTLSITGTGDMYDYAADSANAAPWLLFRDSISTITFPEGITYIGTHAFQQLPLLTDVTIPNAVGEIGESAFAKCAGLGKVVIGSGNSSRLTAMGDSVFIHSRKLYEIHIAATEPPIADRTTFLNYNVHLYVPCESKDKYDLDMVFGDFKYIECLDTDTPVEDFAVTPAQTSAKFVWGAPSNAATYTLDLQQEDAPFFTLVFNATGQLQSISLAPIGSQVRLTAAEKAGNGFTFNATGLTARTLYNYDLTIRDAAEVALQNYSGYFYTTSDIPTGTEDISADDTTPRKVFRDGQVYILRNGKTYTLTGEEVE